MEEGYNRENSHWLDAIHRNFERLLRWAYPPMLVFILCLLSLPVRFFENQLTFPEGFQDYFLWVLIIGFLVAGSVVYLIQSQVINVFISYISIKCRWEKNAKYDGNNLPKGCLSKHVKTFDVWASIIENKWAGQDRRINYLNYAWGMYHATSITGWLTLVFYLCFKADTSLLAAVSAWRVWLFSGLLVLFSLFTYGYLSRVKFVTPNDKGGN